MASLILKENAGIDFLVGEKTVSLNGGGVINFVDDADMKLLKDIANFNKLVEVGCIVIGGKSETVKDDIKQDALNKQQKQVEQNESNNNVKINKG